jgi:hypothetical protein
VLGDVISFGASCTEKDFRVRGGLFDFVGYGDHPRDGAECFYGIDADRKENALHVTSSKILICHVFPCASK